MSEGGFHAWIYFVGRCRRCPDCKLHEDKDKEWEFCPEHDREADYIVRIK